MPLLKLSHLYKASTRGKCIISPGETYPPYPQGIRLGQLWKRFCRILFETGRLPIRWLPFSLLALRRGICRAIGGLPGHKLSPERFQFSTAPRGDLRHHLQGNRAQPAGKGNAGHGRSMYQRLSGRPQGQRVTRSPQTTEPEPQPQQHQQGP
ncbi:UNVERIFIED_CONTAM: hypothetical protein FKN15_066397 [Acipenser sinensis]